MRRWWWGAMVVFISAATTFAFDRVAPSLVLRRWRSSVVVHVVHSRPVPFRSRLLANTIVVFPFPGPLGWHNVGLLLPIPLCGIDGHCDGHWRRSTSGDPTGWWLLLLLLLLHLLLPLGGDARVSRLGRRQTVLNRLDLRWRTDPSPTTLIRR